MNDDPSLALVREGTMEKDEGSFFEISKSNFKSKRHSDRKLNNLKPCKSRKPTDSCFQFITEKDEELDEITLSAQTLVFHLKRFNGLAKDKERVPVNNFQIESLLALLCQNILEGVMDMVL